MQKVGIFLQERVGTVEKQKNDLMMQQAMLQQQESPRISCKGT